MYPPRKSLPCVLVAVVALSACDEAPSPLEVVESGPIAPTMAPSLSQIEGYATIGEVRTGFIYDRTGRPQHVSYEIHDGLAIWEGDIVIGSASEIAQTLAELLATPPAAKLDVFQGVVISGGGFRWPGGVVPYEIAGNLPNQTRVTTAIAWVQDQTPGVTLVPRAGEANFVRFVVGTGCSSEIGMVGGQQNINLADACSTGNTAHEILHALGMYHEHTRCDRDAFVTINYANIEAGREGNFYKAGSGTEAGDCSGAFDIGAYDYGSMMHYGPFGFSDNGLKTITSGSDANDALMGQRAALGPTDIETIEVLYGANNAAPSAALGTLAASYNEGSGVPFDASGSTDADDDDAILTFAWSFGDGTCSGGTPPTQCSDDNPVHPYADNGDYAVLVTVSDGFAANAAGTTVTILNVAPTVNAGADASVNEGSGFSRVSSFADPGADTWTGTVDYGEGAGVQALPLAGMGFTLSHTYIDNGGYTLSVTITDDDGGAGSDNATITVNNVAPSVNAGSDAEVESGDSYAFSGTFSDPGVADAPWAWEIDWGDGSATDNGSTNNQSAPILANHQVCAAGTYTVSLSVTDKDGGAGVGTLSLTVPYIEVAIDIMPGTDLNPVSLRKRGGLPVAILGSADFDVADVNPSTLTLGDGTDPDAAVGAKPNGTPEVYMEDVNGDGHMDLVAVFATTDLIGLGDLSAGTTELVLRGFLGDACSNFAGADMVQPT